MFTEDRILFEDNHIIVVNKLSREIVQADRTGDECLLDSIKAFIKQRDNKPGNVFLGLPHRIDRPTSGIVILAKTSKALSRLSEMFRLGKVKKTYLVLADGALEKDADLLEDYLVKDSKLNKSFVTTSENKNAKRAVLDYKLISKTISFFLYEVRIHTGRHHQIRAQLASRGVHIRGDVKYGAKRSEKDGMIYLHSYKVEFVHPVTKKDITLCSIPDWDRDFIAGIL